MTVVMRIKLDDANLDNTIRNTCDVEMAAGFRLVGAFTVGEELVLIFQKP